MIRDINKFFERPTLYQQTEIAFWDDDYISKQMLRAHLDPNSDGASRRQDFIAQSVSWINKMVPAQSHPYLLDVGCGPGLYAEKFTRNGYIVTGVDFSRRSISYAQHSAQKSGLNIDYIYQNYLTLDINNQFDLAAMIYCDYGALSTEHRKDVLRNIYKHLKPGGKLILDVFSMAQYESFKEKQTWELHKQGGFWRKNEHVELNCFCKYSDRVTLEQYIIISNQHITTYYLWNTCFTEEALTKEVKAAGFEISGIHGDVAGSRLDKKSPTIAVLLVKL